MSAQAHDVTVDHLHLRSTDPEPCGILREILAGPVVCVTGSRACTSYGQMVATELGSDLAHRGVTLLTGAGYGIETAAIRGALGAGGRVVAVLPYGLRVGRHAASMELAQAVLDHGGLVVSFCSDDAIVSLSSLNATSRTIGQVVGAVVIVEASTRSRSLMTAAAAAEMGTPVFAIPGPVTSAASSGAHQLIRDGRARLVTGVRDLGELGALAGRQVVLAGE